MHRYFVKITKISIFLPDHLVSSEADAVPADSTFLPTSNNIKSLWSRKYIQTSKRGSRNRCQHCRTIAANYYFTPRTTSYVQGLRIICTKILLNTYNCTQEVKLLETYLELCNPPIFLLFTSRTDCEMSSSFLQDFLALLQNNSLTCVYSVGVCP